MIIGVTGYFAAGKDSAAEILTARGYRHVSLSDMIRDEIRARGQEISIPLLTRVGNELRRQGGPGVLARRALNVLPRREPAVVTSIRHPAEVETLRERDDFRMIFIDAPARLRYERSCDRARAGDCLSFEEFQAAERAQKFPKDPNAQNLLACKRQADAVLQNRGSREALRRRLEKLIEDWEADA